MKTSTRSELLKLTVKLDQNRTQQYAHMAEMMKKLEILDELKEDLDEKAASKLGIDFPECETSLSVTREKGNVSLSGKLKLSNASDKTTNVICEPLKEDLMRYGEKGPRYVLIYAKISANTLVHPFYGIAQRFGQRWAVMKDLRECPTLASAIQNGQLPHSVLERIAIAHHVATTVDYLHSVEVLVKRLSDRTILLSSENGTITPYLTDLDKARLVFIPISLLNCILMSFQFKEHTTGGEYDVRYEALEFQRARQPRRNIYTDVWRSESHDT
jgi:hypothetical protein